MPEKFAIKFNDKEVRVIRALAAYYDIQGSRFTPDKLPGGEALSEVERSQLLHRFVKYDLLEGDPFQRFYTVKKRILAALYQLDNQESPDYWKSWLTWWFASRWRTVFAVAVVLLPLIVQWVEMVGKVLSWVFKGPNQ